MSGEFDVVISCDNALPHLTDDAQISRALAAMRSKVRPGGLVVISIRDYDRAMIDRPVAATPVVIVGPPRRVLVRLQEWDDDGPMHTVRFLVLTDGGGWTVEDHSVRYRAITRAAVTRLAAAARFAGITWHEAEETGYHQPIMTAVRDA